MSKYLILIDYSTNLKIKNPNLKFFTFNIFAINP